MKTDMTRRIVANACRPCCLSRTDGRSSVLRTAA